MTPFQKDKLENSLKLLRVLLGLLLEMKDFARRHLADKTHKTVMVNELLTQMLDDMEPLWVLTHKHTNKKGKEELVYDAKPMVRMVAQMISDIEEELRVLGKDKDAA